MGTFRPVAPRARLATLLLLALSLGGCGGLHFYDPGLDKVAQETKTQAEALDLISVVETSRENRAKRLDEQAALIRDNKALQARIRLAQVVGGAEPLATSLWSSDEMELRLAALGVSAAATKAGETEGEILLSVSRLRDTLRKAGHRLRSRARRVEIYLGIMPTPCLPDFTIPDLKGDGKNLLHAVPANQRKEFKLVYEDYRDECHGPLGAQPEVQSAMSAFAVENPESAGLVFRTWTDWKAQEEALETLRAAARDSLAALRKAERDYLAAAKVGADTPEKIDEALEQAGKALTGAVKALGAACNVGTKLSAGEEDNPFSTSLVCTKQRETLGTLIEAFTTGEESAPATADPKVKRAATVAAALPGLIRKTGAVVAAGRKVPVAHLRLLKLQASVDLEFARRAVARQEARVRHAQEQWAAALAETDHLWQARQRLCEAVGISSGNNSETAQIACETFQVRLAEPELGGGDGRITRRLEDCSFRTGSWRYVDLLGVPTPSFELASGAPHRLGPDECLLSRSYKDAAGTATVANSVKDAAAHYALAARSAEADGAEAAFRMRAVDGDSALDADERALRLWMNAIVVPVNSLSAYYATGFRPETFAELVVNGAALGAIGAGVN